MNTSWNIYPSWTLQVFPAVSKTIEHTYRPPFRHGPLIYRYIGSAVISKAMYKINAFPLPEASNMQRDLSVTAVYGRTKGFTDTAGGNDAVKEDYSTNLRDA